jgi:hypothetical protein
MANARARNVPGGLDDRSRESRWTTATGADDLRLDTGGDTGPIGLFAVASAIRSDGSLNKRPDGGSACGLDNGPKTGLDISSGEEGLVSAVAGPHPVCAWFGCPGMSIRR